MAKTKTVFAKVQITLEIDTGSWSDTTTFKQVEEQAKTDAKGVARRLLSETNITGIRQVGETVIAQIYATER